MTNRAKRLLATAKRELVAGEKAEATADAHKWAAAEAMWKAGEEEGLTYRQIADGVGVSYSKVGRFVRIWNKRVAHDTRSFAELYYEVQGHTPLDREVQAVERILRERPEVIVEKIAKADPGVRQRFNKAHDQQVERVEREADRKYREAVGPDVADELAQTQAWRDAEHDLVNARGALAGFLRKVNAIEGRDEVWLAHCHGWLDDITAKVEMCRGLLDGGELDDAIDQILAGEL